MNRSFPKTLVVFLVLFLVMVSPFFAQEATQTVIYGGSGGTTFSETMQQSGGRIVELHVYSGEWIDALQISYQLPDGRTIAGERYGGPNGKESVFRLNADEYITAISGRYGDYIDSITVQTNKRTSPRLGGAGGRQDYRIDIPQGSQTVGFAGRSGRYLDAISLITAPIVQRQETQIYGGRGGSPFSDRDIPEGASVSEIRVQSASVVDGIQIVYSLRDGSVSEGPRHGGTGGRSDVFRLDRDEYVTGIYGRYGDYIDSITIVTNKRTSQRFGGQGGRSDFRIDLPGGTRMVGFSGRAARYLDAVGLMYEPILSRTPRRDMIRGLPGRRRPQQ
jgi:hypothetical protein